MVKITSSIVTFFVLSTIGQPLVALAKTATLDDVYARCRQEVQKEWPGYSTDAGKDRMREFAFNSCAANGGPLPQ
jgi:hypothetical protein